MDQGDRRDMVRGMGAGALVLCLLGIGWAGWQALRGGAVPDVQATVDAPAEPSGADPQTASADADTPVPAGGAGAVQGEAEDQAKDQTGANAVADLDVQELQDSPDSYDLFRVTPDGMVTLSGRTTPEADVEALVDGELLGRGRSDRNGQYALMLEIGALEAPRSLQIRVTGAGGTPRIGGETLTIPPIAAPRTLDLAAAGTGAAEHRDTPQAADPTAATEPAPETPAQPQPPQVTPAAAAEVIPDVVVSDASGARVLRGTSDVLVVDAISYDDQAQAVIAGRGAPQGARVVAYLDGREVALLKVGRPGDWQMVLPDVAPGTYDLRVDAVDHDGQVLARAQTPFRRESTALLSRVLSEDEGADGASRVLTVQPGNTLWAIADDTYGDGFLYVRVFEANAGQIRDPDLIYPGQVFALPR